MSEQSRPDTLAHPALGPRVIEVEDERGFRPSPLEPAPRVIATQVTERVVPSEPVNLPAVAEEPKRRRDRTISFALAGLSRLRCRMAGGRCSRLGLVGVPA